MNNKKQHNKVIIWSLKNRFLFHQLINYLLCFIFNAIWPPTMSTKHHLTLVTVAVRTFWRWSFLSWSWVESQAMFWEQSEYCYNPRTCLAAHSSTMEKQCWLRSVLEEMKQLFSPRTRFSTWVRTFRSKSFLCGSILGGLHSLFREQKAPLLSRIVLPLWWNAVVWHREGLYILWTGLVSWSLTPKDRRWLRNLRRYVHFEDGPSYLVLGSGL